MGSVLESGSDPVVGRRFHPDARIPGLTMQPEGNSALANSVARFSLPRYRQPTDFMSGFFALRAEPRFTGESKLNLAVVRDLGISSLHTLLRRGLPRRALSFALVDGTGVGMHPQALLALLAGIAVDFVWTYTPSSRFVWNSP